MSVDSKYIRTGMVFAKVDGELTRVDGLDDYEIYRNIMAASVMNFGPLDMPVGGMSNVRLSRHALVVASHDGEGEICVSE